MVTSLQEAGQHASGHERPPLHFPSQTRARTWKRLQVQAQKHRTAAPSHYPLPITTYFTLTLTPYIISRLNAAYEGLLFKNATLREQNIQSPGFGRGWCWYIPQTFRVDQKFSESVIIPIARHAQLCSSWCLSPYCFRSARSNPACSTSTSLC